MPTIYYRTTSGSLVMEEAPEGAELALPEGATQLTAADYQTALDTARAAREAEIKQAQAEEQAKAQQTYDALITAGIPAEVAARLSGYTPPQPDPDPDEGAH